MIEVIYYRQHHRVTVEGHAFSDEPGRDLVCAGASSLAYTLAANVANMQDKGWVRNTVISMEPGKCEISCNPGSHFRAMVQVIFSAVCIGFELLARDHGQYISYKIRG